ncbi:hypothetical protein COU61_01985 [Candidatus Pacearchaeota archaeon CG10_big_fil_rev_8_21_14_0_10_35_13]|nr:MAG: hypothetical protein COU61_01985 [Candidatus Pacearchaeota archaeon CG10_big_fil_rev_8_21_14_0_10_35_13]
MENPVDNTIIESSSGVVLKREEKIKAFLKSRDNLLLMIILGFTIIFRLYYFFKLGAQPIWWDEGDYLSLAKIWAFDLPRPEWMTHFLGMRPLFLPLLWAGMFKIGFGEISLRFFTELIPSVGAVLVIFLLGKEMYGRKVGWIASIMMSSYWVWNFYTFRLLTDIPAVFLGLLSFYYFFAWYDKRGKASGLYLSLLFGVLAFTVRFPYALVLVTCAFYLLITRKLKILKDKTLWKGLVLLILLLSPYLIYLISINFAPLQFYFGDSAASLKNPIQWNLFPETYGFLHSFWAITGIIGLLTFVSLFLGLDVLWKQKDKSLNPNLLLFLWLFVHFLFYVVIIRAANDRWILMATTGLFLVSSRGIIIVYNLIKPYSKEVALGVVLIFVIGGFYQNIIHSTQLIDSKIGSYGAVKDAGLWLKGNTPDDSRVITASIVQNMYYSERLAYDYNHELPDECFDGVTFTVRSEYCQKLHEELFDKKVMLIDPDYFIISVFEPAFTPDWAYSYPQRHNLTFVKAFPDSSSGSQPLLIIYKFS